MQAITTEQDNASKSRTYYEIMQQRLQIHSDSANAIDAKIGVWFQSAPVVATLIVVGLLPLMKDGFFLPSLLIAALGLGLFALAMWLFWRAQRPRDFVHGMNWEDLADNVNDSNFSAAFANFT